MFIQRSWSLAFALAAAGCSVSVTGTDGTSKPMPASEGKVADRGDFLVQWQSTRDREIAELAESIEEAELVEDVAGALDDAFRLPRDLALIHRDCGEANAFYSPKDGSVTMCYELLRDVLVKVYDDSDTDEQNAKAVVGTWMFVMFHEIGHALIDYFDLPVTGKEEDAVDDFSTVLLVEAGLSDMAVNAARYWALSDQGMYSDLHFADEHSLNPQRFYGILCTVFGSDPDAYASLVTSGLLPETRAARCPSEYAQKAKSWNALLEAYAK